LANSSVGRANDC